MRSLRPPAVLVRALPALALLASIAAPAVAATDTSGSSNWSGYAVHRAGISFKRVSGNWRQPRAHCAAAGPTYSAFWVGIGGYASTSTGIEQIGTEFDCSTGGTPRLTAWYELVPAPVKRISMTVTPGDRLSAMVDIADGNVRLTLRDLTRNETFSQTFADPKADASSAEWITEAPSSCTGSDNCKPLPLSDFGSVTFTGADAVSSVGQAGSILSPLWNSSRIVLTRSPRFVSARSTQDETTPSQLRDGGRIFTVPYARPSTSTSTPPPSRSADGGAAAGAPG